MCQVRSSSQSQMIVQAFQKFRNEKCPVYAFRFNNNKKRSNFYFLKENFESILSLPKSKHLVLRILSILPIKQENLGLERNKLHFQMPRWSLEFFRLNQKLICWVNKQDTESVYTPLYQYISASFSCIWQSHQVALL